MPEYSSCECCSSGDCCTVAQHPKIPAAGTLVAIPDIFPEDYANNTWTAVAGLNWESYTGQTWGMAAYTVVAGGNCRCTYTSRLKFTDLCATESQTDPTHCGTCVQGRVSYVSLGGGNVYAGCDLSIALRAAQSWAPTTCKFYKVELEVMFSWACDEWAASPGNFIKCTDGQVTQNIPLTVVVPANAAVGWSDRQYFTLNFLPNCDRTCCPYLITLTVTVSGTTIKAARVHFEIWLDSYSPGGSTCYSRYDTFHYMWITPWETDQYAANHFFCNPCGVLTPCYLNPFYPNYEFGDVTESKAAGPYQFPQSFVWHWFFDPTCCDSPLTMTFLLYSYTST